MAFLLWIVGIILAIVGLLMYLAGERNAMGQTPESGKKLAMILVPIGLIMFVASFFIG